MHFDLNNNGDCDAVAMNASFQIRNNKVIFIHSISFANLHSFFLDVAHQNIESSIE